MSVLRHLALLLVATLVALPGVRAQDAEVDPEAGSPSRSEGRFIVQTAYTELIDGVYHLNADIDYSLSEAALKALESSLPLTIVIEVELIRHRNWMWDAAVATLRYPYQIQWHPLSRRYLVRDISTGEVDSFANYRAAIAALGQVSDLQVISETLLDTDASYRVRMRAVLDLSEYSAPLRVYASFWSSWTIESDWYEWVLR